MNNSAAQTVAAQGINEDVSRLLALLQGWRGRGGSALDPAVMAAPLGLPAPLHHRLREMDGSGAVCFLSGIFAGPPVWQAASSCVGGRHTAGCASSFLYINEGNLCLSWGGITVQLP